MTEHAAVIFVFFFLAEYASIVLICTLISILFLGGYLYYYPFLFYLIDFSSFYFVVLNIINTTLFPIFGLITEGIWYSAILSTKTFILVFVYIWARASLPRIRFDQLMSFCWTVLLPIVIAFIILIPCILYSFDLIPCNVPLL